MTHPAFLLLAALAVAALFASPRAHAQPSPSAYAVLTGQVTDTTGTPLAGVHVFIASSMQGTTTDGEGRYRLEPVPLGAQQLYVSMVGFAPESRDLLLREPGVRVIDVRLRESVVEVGEITVEAERDEAWARRLARFTRLFIGETPNAAETTILNPEVLDFDESLGRFTARAAAPLEIENRALGYKVQYFLEDFAATPTRIQYDGEPLFEALTPSSPDEAAHWEENRRAAFLGSLRHFLLALVAGRVEGQGFLTYSRPAEARGMGPGSVPGRQRFPLDAADLLSPGEAAGEQTLDFRGFVEIIYQAELEDEAYLDWDWNPEPNRRPKVQTSRIWLDQGPVTIDHKGEIVQRYGLVTSGYMAFERVADEVPKEYRPGA